jgi:hypothetical protein
MNILDIKKVIEKEICDVKQWISDSERTLKILQKCKSPIQTIERQEWHISNYKRLLMQLENKVK